MSDCLVIGGGVVGLSIAYELAVHGARVQVLDRAKVGREASWAGAGILPAAVFRPGDSAYDQLSGLSQQLHPEWSEKLRTETGIDNGYQQCGQVFLARDAGTQETLLQDIRQIESRGVPFDKLDAEALAELEPVLQSMTVASPDLIACNTPTAAQLRNPRHLRALAQACRNRGVTITEDAQVVGFDVQHGRIRVAKTAAGNFEADQFCLASGAWTTALGEFLGTALPIKPIRGQIALVKLDEQTLRTVIHEGPHYIVPRADGRVLVGSTLEDVGFDSRTTAEAITELLRFAASLAAELATAEVERCWAGLRPGGTGARGQPFIGEIPGVSNGWIAAGHFRWGLYLSPATAVVIGELLRGQTPRIELRDFRVDR